MTFAPCTLPCKNFRNLALPCPATIVTCPARPGQVFYTLQGSNSISIITSSTRVYRKRNCLFSTTVAETSLTFPSLKYVIDTGMINMPVYDIQSKRTILTEVRAAESTIKQRLGRLGRTQPGEYYSLYDPTKKRAPFPKPQICQSDLISIEFSLRKSPLKKGFNDLKMFLPDKPQHELITFINQELVRMGKFRSLLLGWMMIYFIHQIHTRAHATQQSERENIHVYGQNQAK
jgi:hypothetical protein